MILHIYSIIQQHSDFTLFFTFFRLFYNDDPLSSCNLCLVSIPSLSYYFPLFFYLRALLAMVSNTSLMFAEFKADDSIYSILFLVANQAASCYCTTLFSSRSVLLPTIMTTLLALLLCLYYIVVLLFYLFKPVREMLKTLSIGEIEHD